MTWKSLSVCKASEVWWARGLAGEGVLNLILETTVRLLSPSFPLLSYTWKGFSVSSRRDLIKVVCLFQRL